MSFIPAQPAQPVNQPVNQQQEQQQNQYVNPTSNQRTNQQSESNSVSETNNVSSNAASLSSYQVNSNHESSYYRYSNGTVLPGTSIYGDFSVINDGWKFNQQRMVGSIGIRHTFGGTAKRVALDSIKKENLNKTLSICNSLGLFDKSGTTVEIDYDALPQLADCQFIKRKTIAKLPVPPVPVPFYQQPHDDRQAEIDVLKNELAQMRLLLERFKSESTGSNLKIGG